MEQAVINQQTYKNESVNKSRELSEKLKHINPPARKIEKAKEFLRKVDPEQFKAVTGRDLFKK